MAFLLLNDSLAHFFNFTSEERKATLLRMTNGDMFIKSNVRRKHKRSQQVECEEESSCNSSEDFEFCVESNE